MSLISSLYTGATGLEQNSTDLSERPIQLQTSAMLIALASGITIAGADPRTRCPKSWPHAVDLGAIEPEATSEFIPGVGV